MLHVSSWIGPPGIKGERGKDGDKGEVVSCFILFFVFSKSKIVFENDRSVIGTHINNQRRGLRRIFHFSTLRHNVYDTHTT